MPTLNLHRGKLTNDHAQSSYNQLVYVASDGGVHGPADVYATTIFGTETIAQHVAELIRDFGLGDVRRHPYVIPQSMAAQFALFFSLGDAKKPMGMYRYV